jgi:hypothetical protein
MSFPNTAVFGTVKPIAEQRHPETNMRNTFRTLGGVVLAAWLGHSAAMAADSPLLSESRFDENVRGLTAERNESERLRQAKELVAVQRLSSLQVKAIAARLGDDAARLEFATAAYPRTVDPENFYEVYDAFTNFSKVLRLHDRIRPGDRLQPGQGLAAPLAPPPPPTVTEADLQDLLRSLRKASFDQTRTQLAQQFLAGSRNRFLSAQIRQIVRCFEFEPNRLEFAKYAYDYTLDQDKYLLVNDAFEFAATKLTLAQYVESRPPTSPPR